MLTDLAENLPTLQENCSRNASTISAARGLIAVAELDWLAVAAGGPKTDAAKTLGDRVLQGPFDLVFGADITWDPSLCPALLETLLVLSKTAKESEMQLEVCFGHTPRNGLIGEDGTFDELTGEAGFPFAVSLHDAGFTLARSVSVGDAYGTSILFYASAV
eukprot:TRINITY_DN10292_c0_g1_i3.p1 TRINITY_DN10292_c0_g1~~TRINITY_DN10292_c0_g1_i3.p1  ORF type:complete len:161 (-),score=27.93 TRINITY_DN10292_c0_g1_i3:171-653(-)